MLRRSLERLERLACSGNWNEWPAQTVTDSEVQAQTRAIVVTVILCLTDAYLVAWSTAVHNSGPINSMVQYHRI